MVLDGLLELRWEDDILDRVHSDQVIVGWAFAVLAEGWEFLTTGHHHAVQFVADAAGLTDLAEASLDAKDVLRGLSRILHSFLQIQQLLVLYLC